MDITTDDIPAVFVQEMLFNPQNRPAAVFSVEDAVLKSEALKLPKRHELKRRH